jgi:outer membrane immunogenic protein
MKKVLVTAAALTALIAAPALAADLPRPALKAPPPPLPPVYSWTGCYIGAGGGYGMWDQKMLADGVGQSEPFTAGGKGWFGTVGGGCDYQLSSDWLIGAFADYDFADIKGTPNLFGFFGHEKETWAWAVGARLGYIVAPGVMGYVNGGYTQKHYDSFEIFDPTGVDTGFAVPSHTYPGWFLGSGYEIAIRILPPGFFWKTEYRFAETKNETICGGPSSSFCGTAQKYQQTVRSELVWRFDWGAPWRATY